MTVATNFKSAWILVVHDDNDDGDDDGDEGDGGDGGGDEGDDGEGDGEGDDFSAIPASGAQLYPVVEMEVKAEAVLEFCFLSPVIMIMIMMVMASIMMMMPECL